MSSQDKRACINNTKAPSLEAQMWVANGSDAAISKICGVPIL